VRDLPHALAHGGIGCAFQPQVDLVTGEVVGLEALARWPVGPSAAEPRSVAVPARKVIEVVEWLNETPALLRCMLARVEAAYAETHGLFAGRFWLNLSPADLAVSEAAETLIETFHAAAVPLDRLGIEVTESLPIVDFEQAVAVLERLRAAGLAIAIDDFGSGNTPLRHLTRLPLDVVKLDQAVTARVDAERSNRVLVTAVRFICEAHGMTLLAEGVETEREIGALREMGVRQAQGYALAPPLALAELVEYLVRAQARPAARAEARLRSKVH
jgi:EAL domain-containing protein (putative c-di-GMP-specific phosphodiesterase class I)